MLPASVELFTFEAALLDIVACQKIESQAAEHGQILRRVTRSRPALVFNHLHNTAKNMSAKMAHLIFQPPVT